MACMGVPANASKQRESYPARPGSEELGAMSYFKVVANYEPSTCMLLAAAI